MGIPFIPGFGTARFQSDFPVGFTPDPISGAVVPGLTYQPLPAPDGSIRGDFETGPRNDGFYVSDPFGRNSEWFDGNTLWNREVGNPEVTKLLNGNDFMMDQLSGLTQWNAGQTPFPPQFGFPFNYPAFPGTPANPITGGAIQGLYGGGLGGFGGGFGGGIGGFGGGFGGGMIPGMQPGVMPAPIGQMPQQQQQQM